MIPVTSAIKIADGLARRFAELGHFIPQPDPDLLERFMSGEVYMMTSEGSDYVHFFSRGTTIRQSIGKALRVETSERRCRGKRRRKKK